MEHINRPPDLTDQPSHRQLTIISMCAQGYSREEIGRELYISPWTVKLDLDELRRLLGARNVTHALALCMTHGLLFATGGVIAALTDADVEAIVGAPSTLEALSIAA